MITINKKDYIIDKYYNEHENPSVIANDLNVVPSYITKIIQKDSRYMQERAYRDEISKEKRKHDKIKLVNSQKTKGVFS